MPLESASPLLLVNDDEQQLAKWRHQAAAAAPGTPVLAASSAYEASELIRLHKPALIVLDVTLPASAFAPMIGYEKVGDLATHSSRVAQAFREFSPRGCLIVASSYVGVAAITSQFPRDATFINPYNDPDHATLRGSIAAGLGIVAPPHAAALHVGDDDGNPLTFRSRIRNIREGLFHHEPEHDR